MTDPAIAEIVDGLSQCLKRLEADEVRFRDNPIRAVGMFAEGERPKLDHLCGPYAASAFLHVDPRWVRMLHSITISNIHNATHDGPYLAFLDANLCPNPDDAGKELDRQERAIRSVEPQLLSLLRAIPEPFASRLLPQDPENWCKVLFHLGIHHQPTFLKGNRLRWISVTGPAPGIDPKQTIPLRYPCEQWWPEIRFQMWGSGSRAPTEDRIPGVVWSRLADDLFLSSCGAIRWLVAGLQRTDSSTADRPDVLRHFELLHQRFAQWGALDRLHRDTVASNPDSRHWFSEVTVVKVADSFRTPPAGDWSGFPMSTSYESYWLARRHADAEYFLYRGFAKQFDQLCREAGAALPECIADRPVMFHRTTTRRPGMIEIQQIGGSASGGMEEQYLDLAPPVPPRGTALNHDPLTRWVRFVCNVHRALDPRQEFVAFHYPGDAQTNNLFRDLYGYVTFPLGFPAASARAIELAELVAEPEYTRTLSLSPAESARVESSNPPDEKVPASVAIVAAPEQSATGTIDFGLRRYSRHKAALLALFDMNALPVSEPVLIPNVVKRIAPGMVAHGEVKGNWRRVFGALSREGYTTGQRGGNDPGVKLTSKGLEAAQRLQHPEPGNTAS